MVRAIALYLPQFHPIPENDLWWGRGFTEWTNTAKAKPLFRGHYQPHIPSELGFYDLRVPETRQDQASLALSAGIEGFCYYHYWFAGRRILERPFSEILETGKPDYPFCLCWANETWTGIWHGAPDRILIEQTYPGEDDYKNHFNALLPGFRDTRYMRVDGKPIFLVYKPQKLPNAHLFTTLWRKLAAAAGLDDIFFVGVCNSPPWDPISNGFDAKVMVPLLLSRPWISRRRLIAWASQKLEVMRGLPTTYPYESMMNAYASSLQMEVNRSEKKHETFPCVIHEWDNTPRSGTNGVVLTNPSPALYREHFRSAKDILANRPRDHRLLFLKSWNEWAEGNHLEPDIKNGRVWLDVVRSEVA